MPSAGWQAWPRVRGEHDLAQRLEQEADLLRRAVRGTRSGPRTRPSTRWRSTATSDRRTPIASNPGQCLWSGIVSPDRARRVVERLLAPGHVLGLGRPHLRGRPARLQPDRLPRRHGVAARRVADRRGLQALRLPRGGEPAGRAHGPRPPSSSPSSGCPSCSAASTWTRRPSPSRTRSRARRRHGRRVRVVPVPRDDARAAPARGPARARARRIRRCPDGWRR